MIKGYSIPNAINFKVGTGRPNSNDNDFNLAGPSQPQESPQEHIERITYPNGDKEKVYTKTGFHTYKNKEDGVKTAFYYTPNGETEAFLWGRSKSADPNKPSGLDGYFTNIPGGIKPGEIVYQCGENNFVKTTGKFSDLAKQLAYDHKRERQAKSQTAGLSQQPAPTPYIMPGYHAPTQGPFMTDYTQPIQGQGLMPVTVEPIVTETGKTRDGDPYNKYSDGSMFIDYPSSWVVMHPNLSPISKQTFYKTSGDTRTEYKDGHTELLKNDGNKIIRYPKESDKIKMTTYANTGITITDYKNGTKVSKYPDGSITTTYPKGSDVIKKTTHTNTGVTTTEYKDGVKIFNNPGGLNVASIIDQEGHPQNYFWENTTNKELVIREKSIDKTIKAGDILFKNNNGEYLEVEIEARRGSDFDSLARRFANQLRDKPAQK